MGLCTLLLLSLAACEGPTKEKHVALAKDLIAAADYPAATLELQSAVEIDSASAEVRWLLGHVYLHSGNTAQAEFELEQAKKLGWPEDDIRPAMAEALLAEGQVEAVLALESLDLNPSAAALLLSTQALAAVSGKQLERARVLMTLALEKEPQLLQAKLAEATITLHEGNPDQTLTLIDAILAANPESGVAWGLRGQSLRLLGRLEDARAAYDQSIARSQITFAERIARALLNLQLHGYEAAQIDATRLLGLAPDDPAVNYIQGVLYFERKQYRKALSALTRAEPAAEQFPQLFYYMSVGYLVEKDKALAEKYGELFVRNAPNDIQGRKLLAVILLAQDQVKKAMKILQPVLDDNPDDAETLNLMANALLLDNQVAAGSVLYNRIAQLRPDWGYVRLRREAGLMIPGAGEEARVPFTGPPDGMENFPQTEILSILAHLRNKDFAGAITAAQSYQYRDFDSVEPYAVLGGVYVAAGMPLQAREVYDKALKRDAWNIAANQGLARLALTANDPTLARRHYTTILEEHEDELSTLLQLAELEASQKNTAAVLSRLDQAATAHPDLLQPRLKLAQYYLESGLPAKVIPLFRKLLELQQRSWGVLEKIALAHLALQQYDKALAVLQQLVEVKPEVVNYHYLLATAASATGDERVTREALMEVVKRDAKHAPALAKLARIALNEGDQKQFEQYLATLVIVAPETTDVLRLQAILATSRGNHVWAAALAGRAFAQSPTSETLLELAAYHRTAGNSQAARTLLVKWINENPGDAAVRLAMAGDLEQAKNLVGANEQYLLLLEQQPENTVALQRLAWNLRYTKPAQALHYIRQAVATAPDQTVLLDTLAVIEASNGDHESALFNIQRALAVRPGDPSVRYHAALIAVARGDKARAIEALEKLVVQDQDTFPEREEATALLRLLKG
jgi:putative PEP-CTERM system TPR-repeat lipoprotein